MSDNWRTEVDALDHFGHQKKRLDIEQRRPVQRRAVDMVGPGIGPEAVRITDFNDFLATYNGYYASVPGAFGAPDSTKPLAQRESFVGITIMDGELGGTQTFTGMVSGNEYRRIFQRNPADPSSISYGPWVHMNAPPDIPEPTPVLPREMGYMQRTSNWSTSNTILYSNTTVPSLAVTVMGEGKAVELIFEGNILNSATGNVAGVWINSNGQNWEVPGGAIGFVDLRLANQNRYLYLNRRVVLAANTQYTFTVGVYAVNAGTTQLTATATYPVSLRVNRLG